MVCNTIYSLSRWVGVGYKRHNLPAKRTVGLRRDAKLFYSKRNHPKVGGGLGDFYNNWTNSILQHLNLEFFFFSLANLINCSSLEHGGEVPSSGSALFERVKCESRRIVPVLSFSGFQHNIRT
jgi:hypothetical protein